MSQSILIVESDTSLSSRLRSALEARGFAVEETADGKGSIDKIRQSRPSLVVMAVELSAGQNGYLLCVKLKKDDDLKTIPVVIIGPPDGFAQHQKLKTRANEYLGKPFAPEALVEQIGTLIGFPEGASSQESVEVSEDFSLSDLVEESDSQATSLAENSDVEAAGADAEIEVDLPLQEPIIQGTLDQGNADADLDMLDAAFDDMAQPPAPAAPNPKTAPPANFPGGERTQPFTNPPKSVSSMSKSGEYAKATTPPTASSGGSKPDKELASLRESTSKKDQEISRLKAELSEKESDLSQLREREAQLEQQATETSGEIAKAQAQVKTLSTRVEQLTAERKKSEQQLQTLRSDVDGLRSRNAELEQAAASSADAAALEAELEQLKQQNAEQAHSFAEESNELKKRIADLEDAAAKQEDRLSKLFGRVKNEEKTREKTKKAISIALQLLEEQPAQAADEDEPAVA